MLAPRPRNTACKQAGQCGSYLTACKQAGQCGSYLTACKQAGQCGTYLTACKQAGQCGTDLTACKQAGPSNQTLQKQQHLDHIDAALPPQSGVHIRPPPLQSHDRSEELPGGASQSADSENPRGSMRWPYHRHDPGAISPATKAQSHAVTLRWCLLDAGIG
ncbi:unnamed protein product [Boreogadus saida]